MPTITPSLFLNVKTLQTGDASPFFSSLTNTASPGPWARVSGPTAGTLRLYLVEPSDNAIPTRVDAGTNTLHLYAKARASDTDLALEIDFTKTADGDYFYYLASAADFSVSTDLWDETGKLDLLCDIIERTTGGADVNAWRTSLTLLRGVADGGSPSPQIYVKVTPQSLSVGEKTQVLTNLGGTTVGKAVFTAIDEAAARTAIGAGTSSFDPAAPGPIGGTTPNTITATAITGGIFTNVIQSIGDSTAAKDSSGNTYFSWGSNVVTYKKLLFLEGSYPGTSTRLSDAGLSGGNVDENANYTETWNVDDATGAALLNSLQVSDSATNGGTVMGPAATTGFAQEWRDSSGDVIAKIDAVDGSFTNYANVTTTSLAATYASFENFDTFTFAVTGNTSLEGTNTGDQTDVPGNAGGLKAGTSAGGEIQASNGTLCASWGAGNGANFTVAALAVTDNTITVNGKTLTAPAASGTLATLAGAETLSNKTLTAPVLGTPASGNLSNCTAATDTARGVVELATPLEARQSTSSTLVVTPEGLRANRVSNAYRMAFSGAGWVGVSSGAGASSTTWDFGQEIIGPTTAAGHALRYVTPSNQAPLSRGQGPGVIDWSKRVEFAGMMVFGGTPDANTVVRASWGKTVADSAGDLARSGIGFRRSGSGVIQAMAHNGTSLTTGTNGTFTPTNGQTFDYIISLSSGTVTITVNDTVVATCTGGPTTAGGTAAALIMAEVQNTATTAAQTTIGHSLTATFIART